MENKRKGEGFCRNKMLMDFFMQVVLRGAANTKKTGKWQLSYDDFIDICNKVLEQANEGKDSLQS